MILKDKNILITGAGGGIGLAFIDELVNRGVSKIYAADLSLEKINPIKEKYSDFIIPIRLDVTRTDLFERFIDSLMDVDVLINNAGIKHGKDILELDSWRSAYIEMNVNYFGSYHLSSLLWNSLKSKKESAIVNILSIASFELLEECPTYCASKAAAHMLTMGLHKKSLETSIKVFAAYPGYIDTDLVKISILKNKLRNILFQKYVMALKITY